jgi:hypothetical protein
MVFNDNAPEDRDHPVLLDFHNLPVHRCLHLALLAHVGAYIRLQQGIGLHDVAPVRAIISSEPLD